MTDATPALCTSTPFDALSDSDDLERVLCGDSSCIGLVGLDGRCKVCGLWGACPSQLAQAAELSPAAAAERPDADAAAAAPDDLGDADDPFVNDSRVLCPDEGCIGVVGGDGRCHVCGRVA